MQAMRPTHKMPTSQRAHWLAKLNVLIGRIKEAFLNVGPLHGIAEENRIIHHLA